MMVTHIIPASTKSGRLPFMYRPVRQKSDFHFRAKAIPDPTPMFGGMSLPEQMDANTFKRQGGVGLLLNNFDFDAHCKTQSFEVVRVSAAGKRTTATNEGARFGKEARKLIDQATAGDIYLFRKLEGKCPGDEQRRKIQGFSVEIK